jgi:hypothetical protein
MNPGPSCFPHIQHPSRHIDNKKLSNIRDYLFVLFKIIIKFEIDHY